MQTVAAVISSLEDIVGDTARRFEGRKLRATSCCGHGACSGITGSEATVLHHRVVAQRDNAPHHTCAQPAIAEGREPSFRRKIVLGTASGRTARKAPSRLAAGRTLQRERRAPSAARVHDLAPGRLSAASVRKETVRPCRPATRAAVTCQTLVWPVDGEHPMMAMRRSRSARKTDSIVIPRPFNNRRHLKQNTPEILLSKPGQFVSDGRLV